MQPRIHHLTCNALCPPGWRLTDGRRGAAGPATLCCHCLLVERRERLVLVDTGLGLEDVAHPRERLSFLFRALACRPRLREEDTAVRQLQRLGVEPEDVTDIVLTHLDFDHAGGLDDFPRARVHLLADEARHASSRVSAVERGRYRPEQWRQSMPRWRTHPLSTGERWYDFEAVRSVPGLEDEVLLVPLAGHTLGHCGVAVRRSQGWYLHAGDAYFFHGELDATAPHCPPGLRLLQWMMEQDRPSRRSNQERLRALLREHGGQVRVFCAHDLSEYEALRRAEPAFLHAVPGGRAAAEEVHWG